MSILLVMLLCDKSTCIQVQVSYNKIANISNIGKSLWDTYMKLVSRKDITNINKREYFIGYVIV